MKKLNSFLGFLLIISIFSCSKKNDTPLKGEWEEIPDNGPKHEWRTYNYKFECNNTFQLEISITTDAASPLDSCSKWSWKEYAAGTYKQNGNILKLTGVYTDSLYQPISIGCHNIGNAQLEYEIIKSGDQVSLKGRNGNVYPDYDRIIKLKKIKDIICNGGGAK